MFLRRSFTFVKDPVWFKITTFSIAIFFIGISDALLSYWIPNLLEDVLRSPILVGIVISFQSVVGLFADLIFPKLLKQTKVRRLMILAIIACLLTMLTLVTSTWKPYIAIFLVSMATWGLYYEFVGFAQYQFVADSIPVTSRAGAWGVIGIFRNLAYFLGPLIAAYIMFKGNILMVVLIAIFLLIAYVVISASKKVHEKPIELDFEKMNIFREMGHWLTLSKRVWPMIIVSFVMGCIDATFWTTGAVLTEKLASVHYLGGLFLSFYALPSLFTGFIVARLGIFKGKKRLSIIFLLLSGIPLLAFSASEHIYWLLMVVLTSSIMLGISYPFAEGVFSDIEARLGSEKKHMVGLTGSVINLSYIIWPIVAGIITQELGDRMTFVIMGIITISVASLLLAITPKKLKLPQKEVRSWPD
jgi:MFS family permease